MPDRRKVLILQKGKGRSPINKEEVLTWCATG